MAQSSPIAIPIKPKSESFYKLVPPTYTPSFQIVKTFEKKIIKPQCSHEDGINILNDLVKLNKIISWHSKLEIFYTKGKIIFDKYNKFGINWNDDNIYVNLNILDEMNKSIINASEINILSECDFCKQIAYDCLKFFHNEKNSYNLIYS